jgi:hypothetical protein
MSKYRNTFDSDFVFDRKMIFVSVYLTNANTRFNHSETRILFFFSAHLVNTRSCSTDPTKSG